MWAGTCLSINLGLSGCWPLIQHLNYKLSKQIELTLTDRTVFPTIFMAQSADGGKTPGNCCILASETGRAKTTLGTLESTIPLGDGSETWTSFIRLLLGCHLNSNADRCTGGMFEGNQMKRGKEHSFLFCIYVLDTRDNVHCTISNHTFIWKRFVAPNFSTFA